jgi:hypothetical protein
MQTQIRVHLFSFLAAAGVCAAVAVAPLSAEPPSSAHIQWVNICAGCPNNPFGITENGVISGTVSTPQGERGFLLSRQGEITWIDTPGNVFIEVQRGNNRGQVTGAYFSLTDFTVHGFVRERDGTLRDVVYPGAMVTVASSISDRGDVLASYTSGLPPAAYVSYIERNGAVSESIKYPGASTTIALGINSSGDLAGVFMVGDTPSLRGFIRTRDNAWIEVAFPAASEVFLSDINAAGTAVGYWRDLSGHYHGLLYRDGLCYTVEPGPSPSGNENTTLTGINNSGDIVGVVFPFMPGDGDGFLMSGAVKGVNVTGSGAGTPCAIPIQP